jgi:hypothetical protein
VPERWRSSAARDLAAAIRKAGGIVERGGRGRLQVTGPKGTITIQEPAGDTRPDLQRDSAARKITAATGLQVGGKQAP